MNSVHNILLVQFMCLTVLFHNLSPGLTSLPLGLEPSPSYFIHFFTQSLFTFCNTCPYVSRITNKTKLHLCRVFILPIMLYRSECWAVNKVDIPQIDPVNHWCLQRILDIRFHDFVRNADIHRITNQPPLSPVVSLSLGI